MTNEIKQITAEEARQIIDSRKPLGSFWHVGDYSFVGIDNRHGNAWTEEFTDFNMLAAWLNGVEMKGLQDIKPLKKFENVNVIETLREIMRHNTESYQTDFEYDAHTLGHSAPMSSNSKTFLWMSRRNGTWLFDERDAYIHNTHAYNTWRYYSAGYDSVKAFRVELTGTENGTILGNICELDYDRHKDYIAKNTFSASAVEVTFKSPHSIRTFDPVEYNNNLSAISGRYGQIEKSYYMVSDEYALQSIMRADGDNYYNNSVDTDIGKFIRDLDKDHFRRLGYTTDDMTFISHDELNHALKYHIPVYALSEMDNKQEIQTAEDISRYAIAESVFGIKKEDRPLLDYLISRQNSRGELFSRDELKELYCLTLSAGKSNESNLDLKTLEQIVYKLDKAVFSLPAESEQEQANIQARSSEDEATEI